MVGKVFTILFLGGLLVLSSPAGARRVSGSADVACGTPITADVTLQHDLVCSGDGLVIETPTPGTVNTTPIVVNLNGHTVSGGGAGKGIVVDAFATIKNGTVRGFATGVYALGSPEGAPLPVISRLHVIRNGTGVQILEDFTGLSMVDSTIADNSGDGVAAGACSCVGMELLRTTVLRNGGNGVRVGFFDGWSIKQSVLSYNRLDGLRTDDSSGGITDSVASHNGEDGIDIFDNCQCGFFVPRVANDTADFNGNWGMIEDVGLPLIGPAGNVARHNGQAAQCLFIICASSR